MLSRRSFLAGSMTGIVAFPRAHCAWGQAVLTDDGLYRQPWFLESFLELADDLEAASEKGRRFAVIWELKGCPYCRQTHVVNFARPEIADYVKQKFDILQLNIIGAREVTDFDSEKMTEKRLAQKYGIRATPTFQFFRERSADVASRKPRQREAARAQGYLLPEQFLAMFKFVSERAYERGSLDDYLKANGLSSGQ